MLEFPYSQNIIKTCNRPSQTPTRSRPQHYRCDRCRRWWPPRRRRPDGHRERRERRERREASRASSTAKLCWGLLPLLFLVPVETICEIPRKFRMKLRFFFILLLNWVFSFEDMDERLEGTSYRTVTPWHLDQGGAEPEHSINSKCCLHNCVKNIVSHQYQLLVVPCLRLGWWDFKPQSVLNTTPAVHYLIIYYIREVSIMYIKLPTV